MYVDGVYGSAVQVVVETPVFFSDARAAGVDEVERASMVDTVAADPKRGDLIVGTGGARKLRFAGRGKGKSGGYRVLYYFGGDDIPIFMLNVFSKGDKANLTKAERNTLAAILAEIGRAYREGVPKSVRDR